MNLIIASTNMHKVRELRSLLHPLKGEIYSLMDFPDYIQPPETGMTFEENALLKAEHAAKHLKKWVIADDSGLVVPALEGRPGVFSARYAGEQSSDKENRKKLLKEMEGLHDIGRSAYFECCIALCSPLGQIKCVRGTVEGTILTTERGGRGFGYDPLFVKHDYSQSFGELDESIKNRISHRAKAMEKLKVLLNASFG